MSQQGSSTACPAPQAWAGSRSSPWMDGAVLQGRAGTHCGSVPVSLGASRLQRGCLSPGQQLWSFRQLLVQLMGHSLSHTSCFQPSSQTGSATPEPQDKGRAQTCKCAKSIYKELRVPFFKSDNGLMLLIKATFGIVSQRSDKELHQKNVLREGEEKAESAGYRQYELQERRK